MAVQEVRADLEWISPNALFLLLNNTVFDGDKQEKDAQLKSVEVCALIIRCSVNTYSQPAHCLLLHLLNHQVYFDSATVFYIYYRQNK
jgi:hypothetical protein